MSNIFPIDFEEKLSMAQDDFILFSDSEDGNKIKKAQYKNLKGEKGDPGATGTAATITVGTTSTGAAGTPASVTNSGTSSAAVLNFTIPKGAKGDDGNAATITVGTTTTGAAGTNASVTNSGTSTSAVLNFTIPKGADGENPNVKEFALSSSSDLTNGQAAYDYFVAGNYPIIRLGGKLYYPYSSSSTAMFWEVPFEKTVDNSSTTGLQRDGINMTLSSGTVTALTTTTIFINNGNFLRTGKDYPTPYTPEYNGSPATKKYVDDSISGAIYSGSSAPATPTEGMLWYDTTNDVLKTYDGSNWNAVGSGSGDVVVSTDTGNELSTGAGLWFGTESDFSSISTPDSNTLYIQYKSEGGGGWTPGVNTVLYLPLNSTDTYTDQSGNSRTTTNTNVTFGTNYGVDCGYFGGNAHIQITPFQISSSATFLCWCYNNAVTTSDAKIFDARNSSNWYINLYQADGDQNGYFLWLISGQTKESNHLIQGEWVLFCTTVTNGSQNVYVKGNNIDLHYTSSNSFSSFTPSDMNVGNEYNNGSSRFWKGGLSNLILEDKERTAQEISDYYNQTKGDYGIS